MSLEKYFSKSFIRYGFEAQCLSQFMFLLFLKIWLLEELSLILNHDFKLAEIFESLQQIFLFQSHQRSLFLVYQFPHLFIYVFIYFWRWQEHIVMLQPKLFGIFHVNFEKIYNLNTFLSCNNFLIKFGYLISLKPIYRQFSWYFLHIQVIFEERHYI